MEREADAVPGAGPVADQTQQNLIEAPPSGGEPEQPGPARATAQPATFAGRAMAFADFDSCAYLYAIEAGAAQADEPPTVDADCAPAQDAAGETSDAEPATETPDAALQWALANPVEQEDESACSEEVDFEMAPDGESTSSVGLSADGQVEVRAGDALLDSMASIPQKMAFKIGEAAEMIGVKQYVLRYWESEFDQLRPKKSKNNQRIYSRRDVETALMIKKLLYVDRFSIEGARGALRQLKREVKEERGIKAAACAHESAINGLKHLLARIEDARARFAERL